MGADARRARRRQSDAPDRRRLPGHVRHAEGQRQHHGGAAVGDHRQDQGGGRRSRERVGRNLHQHHRSVAAHRGAGRKPRADLGLDGGDFRDGEEERRERPAGQSVRRHDPRGRGPRRRGGGPGGRGDVADRGIPRARFPTSSASSTRSRGRPTCSRSMRRWKRRAPAMPAAALRWSPPRCEASRSARRRRRKTSPT